MKNRMTKTCRSCFAIAALLAGPTASASIVISELLYDVSGPDAGQVFVELYGTPGTVLDGMFLDGVNGSSGSIYMSAALTGVMPVDGIFVIGDDDGSGTSLVNNADLVADVDFQNGPDSVVLRDSNGILDALGYGDFSSAVFAGEGSPVADVASGWSLARMNPALDTDNNQVDFFGLDIPTPGLAPASAVPAPAAAWLFLSGIAGLVGVSRRKT
jgi:hypothetical protein